MTDAQYLERNGEPYIDFGIPRPDPDDDLFTRRDTAMFNGVTAILAIIEQVNTLLVLEQDLENQIDNPQIDASIIEATCGQIEVQRLILIQMCKTQKPALTDFLELL